MQLGKLLVASVGPLLPWRVGGEVAVRLRDQDPKGFERLREVQLVKCRAKRCNGRNGAGAQRGFGSSLRAGLRHGSRKRLGPAKVLVHHVDDAADEVAVAVGQVAVEALDERIEAEAAVLSKRDFAQQEVAQRIGAQNFLDRFSAHDVALRLGHLALVKEQPAVGFHAARRLNARGHQKRRPVDAVETADLLADQVHVRRPEFFEARLVLWIVGAVADCRDVVGQRVEPHVDHVLLVAGNRNAPGETCPAYGQVFEAAADKGDDLAPRRLRPDEPWVGVIKLQQLALEGRQLEKVVLLAHRFGQPPAVGAVGAGRAVHVCLVGDAVLAGVRALVDEAAIAQGGEELLHAALVAVFRGADEVVVGDAEAMPEAAELGGDGGGKLGRRAPRQLGRALDLLSMLVCTGQEPGIDAQRPLAPRNGVADDGRVGVPQVRPRIHVVDGRGEVIAGLD